MKSYNSVVTKENHKIFIKKFTENLYKKLLNYFQENDADRIIQDLIQGNASIKNVENFLFSAHSLQDPSFQLRKEYKEVNDFTFNSIMYFKKRAEKGDTDILVREFFLILCEYLKKSSFEKAKGEFKSAFTNLLITLSNSSQKSPFIIQIPHYMLQKELESILELDLKHYKKAIYLFSDIYLEIYKKEPNLFLPRIELIYPLFKNAFTSQEDYLHELFPHIEKDELYSILQCLPSLSFDTPQLRSTLESFAEENMSETKVSEIITNLQKIEDKITIKSYPEMSKILPCKDKFTKNAFKELLENKVIFQTYTEKKSYFSTFMPYLCDLTVNCYKKSLPEIESYLKTAEKLCLLKSYLFKDEVQDDTGMKVRLQNLRNFSLSYLLSLKKEEQNLRNRTGKNIFFEITFSMDNKGYGTKLKRETGYVRIISDIHADYNAYKNYKFDFQDDFILNCGDTSGNASSCIKWINKYMTSGCIVMGNHLGYSPAYPELNKKLAIENAILNDNTRLPNHPDNTKSGQLMMLSRRYYKDGGLRFISNSTANIDGMIIIGSTLYTDFALYGKKNIAESMQFAKQGINDFKLITVLGHRKYTKEKESDEWKIDMKKREDGIVRLYTPEDHAYYFNFSFRFIKKKVEEYKDKPLIIMTHFAPSPYSLDPKYAGSPLNPFFASNLNEFIISHPQIRLWAHGHCHNISDYILGQTRVVCCPFGYYNENNFKLPYEYGIRILKDHLNSKVPWTEICKQEIEEGKMKVYTE